MSRSASASDGGRPAAFARRIRRFAAACLLAAAAASPAAFPQESPGPPIAGVDVRADGLPADPALGELVGLRAGDAYSLRAVDEAVKRLHQTGLFADIRVSRLDGGGGDGIVLRFDLTRRLRIGTIAFLPERGLPQGPLRKDLETVRRGGFFEEDETDRALEDVRRVLRREGYFDAAVELEPIRDVASGTVDLVFRVSTWRTFRVGGLVLRGGPEAPDELRGLLKTKPGEPYVPARLAQDLSRLQAHFVERGHRRARVNLAETFAAGEDTVDLAVDIEPGEKISLLVRGADVSAGLIAPIWEERVFEEWGLAEGEARILEELRSRGHLFASVVSRVERDGDEIQVIHDVEPGGRYSVDALRFEGLESLDPGDVRARLGIGEKILFFPLIGGERLFELPRELELLLRSEGFPDARVSLDWERRDRSVTGVLRVVEGPRQTVRGLSLEGVGLFPEAELRAELLSAEGRPYLPSQVQRDLEKIATFYLNRGIRGTRVDAEVNRDGNAFDLLYRVSEGERTTIAGVIITGNRVTRLETIRRELLVREGEPARADLIQESRRRLERLGIFSEVRVEEIAAGPGRENLVVTVGEGERNYAGLGVGLETKSDPRSVALWENDIRPRGTAEFIRSNIFGAAAQLSLVTQFSLIEKRAVASWEQPYLLGLRVPLSLIAWLEDEDRTSFGFDRRGVTFNTARPVGGFVMLGTLSWSRTRLTFLKIRESQVDRQLFPYSTTLASVSAVWERRDDTFNPERGMFFSVVGEYAYPLFRTEADYLKAFFKWQSFWPLVSGFNVALTARAGLGRGKIPIPERFFAGGGNSFRGAEFDRLGPADEETGMPIGGKAMFLLNAELKFPLLRSLPALRGAVFYDMGNVFSQRADFSLFAFRGALGFGLRYRTPLGPVRFDLGWSLDDPAGRKAPFMFITIGNIF